MPGPDAVTRLALLTALLSLTLAAGCIPSGRQAAAPARQEEPALPPPLASVVVHGRERCPSTHEGYSFAGSQREGDMATCFYR
jgi:hypothetical protein